MYVKLLSYIYTTILVKRLCERAKSRFFNYRAYIKRISALAAEKQKNKKIKVGRSEERL